MLPAPGSERANLRSLRAALLGLAGVLAATTGAAAHGVELDVATEPAVVLTLIEDDGHPLAHEAYEIRPEGREIPFQTGRTDARGRIAFAPGRAGAWRLSVHTEDGHGVDTVFETGEGGEGSVSRHSWSDRSSSLLTGVALILGLFGALKLFSSRR